MDRFNALVEEFVPDDGKPFERQTVVKLMELAFRLGQNCGLKALVEGLNQEHKPQS